MGTLSVYDISQFIEDVRTFAGQTVTISFWAKADSARTLQVYTGQNFGSGGSSTVFTTVQNASVTTSWQRFAFNFAIGSVSGKTMVQVHTYKFHLDKPLQAVLFWIYGAVS